MISNFFLTLEQGLIFHILVVGLKRRSSRRLILAVPSNGKPESSREIQKATRLSGSTVK